MNSTMSVIYEKCFPTGIITVAVLFLAIVGQPTKHALGAEPEASVASAAQQTNRIATIARINKLGPLTVPSQNLSSPSVMPPEVAEQMILGLRKTDRDKAKPVMSAAQPEVTRGPELTKVYRNSAPSVVLIVVAGGGGHGSGFIVSQDGWLVTNHHVAKEAILSDRLTREVTVHFGRLNKMVIWNRFLSVSRPRFINGTRNGTWLYSGWLLVPQGRPCRTSQLAMQTFNPATMWCPWDTPPFH